MDKQIILGFTVKEVLITVVVAVLANYIMATPQYQIFIGLL